MQFFDVPQRIGPSAILLGLSLVIMVVTTGEYFN
jgi:hypothetical protein